MKLARYMLWFLLITGTLAIAQGIANLVGIYWWGDDGSYLPWPFYAGMLVAGLTVLRFMWWPLHVQWRDSNKRSP